MKWARDARGPGETGREAPVVVILAGGAGTRFWPMSTEARPKQFLRLFGDRSLLQQSYDRAVSLTRPERVLVLTGQALVPLVREQLPELGPDNVIGEPVRRDTAAAVALAALIARARFGAVVLVTLTADHRIEPHDEFVRVVTSAVEGAAADSLLYTLGIPPTHAATAYGYLERGPRVGEIGGVAHFDLARFREKPDRETAEGFLSSGRFLWNSGMFVWSASAILERFAEHLPGHLAALQPVVDPDGGSVDPRSLEAAFGGLPAVSVDYGIMEKSSGVRVVEATFSWSDVGAWEAVGAFLPEDPTGNRGAARLVSHEATGNVVFTEDPDELVALVGVEGLAVVRAGKRTLVVPLARAEEVKELVKSLGVEDQ